MYTDPEHDLALLKVTAPEPLPHLPLATRKSKPVRRYLSTKDPVFLLRYDDEHEDPKLEALNATVSTLGVYNSSAGPGPFVGLKTDVQKGQSGGPVLDRQGRVVGIVTWTWKHRASGYAIPIGEVTDMLAERPKLSTDTEHASRAEERSREFLAALGRGDVDDARRLTSPSHARHVREEAVQKILRNVGEQGMSAIWGFLGALESVIESPAGQQRFTKLQEIVSRTTGSEFRVALGVDEQTEDAQLISFFFELGQTYLVARTIGKASPKDALDQAMRRLQTVDAARTFALADALDELAGAEVEIQEVQLVPGVYHPTAVVNLKTNRLKGRFAKKGLSARFGRKVKRADSLTLHMRLEWGDWYVASVSPTPLAGG